MGFVDDLMTISRLPKNQLDLLIEVFQTNPLSSVSNILQYQKFCADNNIDKEDAVKFYKVLAFIVDYFINEKSIEKGNIEFEEKVIKNTFPGTENIWTYLKEKIPTLNEFILLRKEHHLSKVANKLERLDIICDIRPVYDIKRENILKYLFPIIISLEEESSNSKLVFETDEPGLYRLQKEINTAISKLEIIKERFKNA